MGGTDVWEPLDGSYPPDMPMAPDQVLLRLRTTGPSEDVSEIVDIEELRGQILIPAMPPCTVTGVVLSTTKGKVTSYYLPVPVTMVAGNTFILTLDAPDLVIEGLKQ